MVTFLRRGVLAVLFFVPTISHGAVLFSEIAWMGTDAGADNEWIELFNHGTSVQSVEGWTLSDGDDINIVLGGAIPPMGIVLLERTSDDTVPGVAAFQTYTGSLKNSGEKLTLKDAGGALIAEVDGGTDWAAIGGVNESPKQTPQQGQRGWVVGTPTPGRENVGHDAVAPAPKTTALETAKTSESSAGSRISLSDSKNTGALLVSIRLPERVYVNQPVVLIAEPSGLGRTVMNSLAYSWNFGDFETARGREVVHTFDREGTYAVVIEAVYKEYTAIHTETVTVLPVAVTLSLSKEGDAILHNDTSHDIDVSKYVIRASEKFEFPKHSIILAGKSVTVPVDRFGGGVGIVPNLTDGLGNTIEVAEEKAMARDTESVRSISVAMAPTPVRSVTSPSGARMGAAETNAERASSTGTGLAAVIDETSPTVIPLGSTALASVGGSRADTWVPYLALLLLIIIGSVFVSRKFNTSSEEGDGKTQTF